MGRMMSERMTWKEIMTEYPDQWVGLVDVEHEKNNSSTIISAVVKHTGRSKNELTLEQIQTNGKMLARYTTPENTFQLGVLG